MGTQPESTDGTALTSPTLYIQTSETDLQLLLTIAQLKNDLQTANRQKKAADSTAAESERKSKEFQKEATAQRRKAEENAKLFEASQRKGTLEKIGTGGQCTV